jgi:hypothetical protein
MAARLNEALVGQERSEASRSMIVSGEEELYFVPQQRQFGRSRE